MSKNQHCSHKWRLLDNRRIILCIRCNLDKEQENHFLFGDIDDGINLLQLVCFVSLPTLRILANKILNCVIIVCNYDISMQLHVYNGFEKPF